MWEGDLCFMHEYSVSVIWNVPFDWQSYFSDSHINSSHFCLGRKLHPFCAEFTDCYDLCISVCLQK